MKKMVLRVTVFILLLAPVQLFGQFQQLTLDYNRALSLLLTQNIQLVASQYNIDIAEAQALQAKQWNNPYFIWNSDMYSVENNQYLNSNHQRLIQIEQTFSIAGKHTNSVKLSRINVELNKLIFQDVMRSLQFELFLQYILLAELQAKDSLYQHVLTNFDSLIKGAQQQVSVGTLAGNELIRLQSEQMSMYMEAVQLKNQIQEVLQSLRVLLHLPEETSLIVSFPAEGAYQLPALPLLKDEGLTHRPDYLLSVKQIDYANQNLKLQRSMAVPDLKVGFQPHDKGSNYVRPYSGITVEFPLPIFDRNQGRIQESKCKIEQSMLSRERSEEVVRNEITSAYMQFLQVKQGLQLYTPPFIKSLEDLRYNAELNYTQKNISLLAFIDQQRIYLQTMQQYYALKSNYLKAAGVLNFTVSKTIIPFQ